MCSNLYGSRPASRARCLTPTPGPGLGPAAGASDEAQRLVLADRPRVPRAAPGAGHAFPGAAPVPSHVTTPRDSRPSGGRDERMQAHLGLNVKDFFQENAENLATCRTCATLSRESPPSRTARKGRAG